MWKNSLLYAISLCVFISGCATVPDKAPMTEAQKQDKIQSYITTAKNDVNSNNYAVALLHYEQVLDLDKNNIQALIGAGNVTYKIQKY